MLDVSNLCKSLPSGCFNLDINVRARISLVLLRSVITFLCLHLYKACAYFYEGTFCKIQIFFTQFFWNLIRIFLYFLYSCISNIKLIILIDTEYRIFQVETLVIYLYVFNADFKID